MNWLTIVAKLEALKEIATHQVPDSLDKVADVLDKAAEAVREAEAMLRSYAAAGPDEAEAGNHSGQANEAVSRLEKVKAELENRPKAAGPDPTGGWEEILVPVILEIVKRILDRLKNR